MTRLFTFGCSFTSYSWPTWADILSKDFDFFENWGRTGGGNQFIANSIIECHIKKKFTKQDTVCIMWSNMTREDRYVNGSWLSPGNIFTQGVYPKSYVKKFADIRGYYIRDLATIYMIDQLLTGIGCRVVMMSIVPIELPQDLIGTKNISASNNNNKFQDLLIAYKPVLDKIKPSVLATVFHGDWQTRPRRLKIKYHTKNHNTLQQHYNKIKDPTWPPCTSAKEFERLPDYIKKECLEVFNLDIKKYSDYSWPKKLKIFVGTQIARLIKPQKPDHHPTPDEYLMYLDCIGIPVTTATRKWIAQIDALLHDNQSLNNYWNKSDSLPERW